jgi:hypothetical protein
MTPNGPQWFDIDERDDPAPSILEKAAAAGAVESIKNKLGRGYAAAQAASHDPSRPAAYRPLNIPK